MAKVQTVKVSWVGTAPARAIGCIGITAAATTSIAATATTRRTIDSHPRELTCVA